jgi:hypothetical protein
MILLSAMPSQIEIPAQNAAQPQARDGFRIEEILRRARQIHREHGGLFGYDFDDWAQAWAELPQSATQINLQSAGEKEAESLPARKHEVLEPCFSCGN